MSPIPRGFVRRAFAVAGAIALAAAGCSRDRTASDDTSDTRAPFDESKLVDLTYPFDSTTLYWSPDESFRVETVSRGMTPGGYWYASNRFCASEHGGTHLDAPIHFGEGKSGTDGIPLARLAGPACVVDVSAKCAENPDYRLTVLDLRAWESEHGPLPDGAIVLMRSGWGARWPDRMRYFGAPAMTETESYHFPGFSREAAEFLTRERKVDAVGLDTPSLDHGASRDFIAHRVFAAADVPGLENVANLDRLPPRGAWVLALPIAIRGGTGGPARIVAFLP
jgi:kynurenine formamidase